jgi:hypothetical protein
LSLRLELDPTLVGSVMVEAGHPAPRSYSAVKAIDVSPLDAGLLDAVVRLLRLLNSPTEARFLAPLITREGTRSPGTTRASSRARGGRCWSQPFR